MSKRIIDLILCLITGLLLLPLCIIIVIAIKVADGGGIIYQGQRLGRHGKNFFMLKFRTMKSNERLPQKEAEDFNHNFKLIDDPRITRTGKWLRQYSLDEIPQLINVLKGDMAMIGPRPKLPEEVYLYKSEQEELLSVLPGITGYWQVFRKNASSDEVMRCMDLFYIRNRNILLDLKILLLTPGIMLRKKNY